MLTRFIGCLIGWTVCSFIYTVVASEGEVTPAEWLKFQPKPVFAAGHTLPPLTRFGWVLPLDTRIELTERWGYALEFGGYATHASVDSALNDSKSDAAKLIALTSADPKKYPLCIILSRDLPDQPEDIWTHDADGKLLGGKSKIWSPEAPKSALEQAAALRAEPLKKLRARVPVAMVLNGGEYALGVLGFAQKDWEKDPKIAAARGNKDWFEYMSEKKALMENIIADAVRAADPDRTLYIYYTSGGGTHRNRNGDWKNWCYGYEWMRMVGDLPSNEYYYKHFNSGWTGPNDMLTLALNARGHELKFDAKFSYDWLCDGWIDESAQKGALKNDNPAALVDETAAGNLGDFKLYTGFLKCLYTTGTLGGNAGYYAYPKGGYGCKFPSDKPPHWLQQMVRLAHVHAFFSKQESLLRNSELLPGPNKHVWSKDQPAYEFPCNVPGVRVVARKHTAETRWLITAWAADGKETDISVEIPELGTLNLHARPEASVYAVSLANQRSQVELLDLNGMQPTLQTVK